MILKGFASMVAGTCCISASERQNQAADKASPSFPAIPSSHPDKIGLYSLSFRRGYAARRGSEAEPVPGALEGRKPLHPGRRDGPLLGH